MTTLRWNESAVNDAFARAAELLNTVAVDAVSIAKNTPGKFPARGSPGRNAPYRTGTYQRGIRLGDIATAQRLQASIGVFGVGYARDIEQHGAFNRPWRGQHNLRDAVAIALEQNGLGR